jgi:hypothetical protein
MATTPEKDDTLNASTTETVNASESIDEEVMKIARQFMDKYSNLLRRLAE